MGKRFTKSLVRNAISWVLISALTIQPAVLAAQTIQVVGPDNGPRPRVDKSYNGTTVLNIGTPNSAGVSHDLYTEFTAGDLILNNSATNVATQLGGWIEGNPNLAPGAAADLWIGEVVGGSQTRLNGILEVGGASMDVVLANEFGITCNGCGFINTDRATLTTGKPRFGLDGALQGFDVRRGQVVIGAGGLNPEGRLALSDLSRVDVIARAAAIYGALRADQLNLVAGANVVDYNWAYDPQTGAVTGITEQAGEGAAPALAVDVAALGGMYANAIKMVATENGVGVRLDGEMASSSNIALRADGQLSLGAPSNGHVPKIKAKQKITIRNQGPILLEGSVISEDGDALDIRSTEGALIFRGEADGGAITLESAGLVNISGAIAAARALKVSSDESVTLAAGSEVAAQSLDLDAAGAVALDGKAAATGAFVADAGAGLSTGAESELSGNSLALTGQSLATAGDATTRAGLVMTAGVGGAVNSGSLSGMDVAVTSGAGLRNDGKIAAADVAQLSAAGLLASGAASEVFGGNVTLFGGSATLDGVIKADAALIATTRSGDLGVNGTVAGNTVTVTSAADLINAGAIVGSDGVILTATDGLRTEAGSEVSAAAVQLAGVQITTHGDVLAEAALELRAGSGGIETGGALIGATTTLTSDAGILNRGSVTGTDAASLTAATALQSDAGSALYGAAIDLRGAGVTLDGVVKADDALAIVAGADGFSGAGDLSAGSVTLTSGGGIALSGILDVAQDARLVAAGAFASGSDAAILARNIAINAASFDTDATLLADAAVTLQAGSGLLVNGGLIGGTEVTLISADTVTNAGRIAAREAVTVTATGLLQTKAGSEISGRDVALSGAGVAIAGDVVALAALEIAAGAAGIENSGDLIGETTRLTSGAGIANSGSITGRVLASLTMADDFTLGTDFAIYGAAIEVAANAITANGVVAADAALTLNAGAGGLRNSGSLSAQDVTLTSQSTVENSGIVSAGGQLSISAATTLTNAATLIAGGDLAIFADQIINNGGVIWANDSVTLAANAALDRAGLVQNTGGRIEAFQGDLTLRADEVANLGTAPTIGASEIIKWLEKGSSGPVEPVAELAKLIDPAYLDADGNILPAYSAQYAALWADVIRGGAALSAASQSILKPGVTTPSGTAIKSDFAGLWKDMEAKANVAGTPDPAALVKSMVKPGIFDANGLVLPAHAEAYAALWQVLAAGGTSVSDAVKDILAPASLVVASTSTDPVTNVVTTVYSNDLVADKTNVWAAMTAGSGAAYDIVKILYQDRFNDDGALAELVAGGKVDIVADEVRNIFGNISAGDDLFITANSVTNQALGASQVLLEVHKKPGCFTCHNGEVDFYDTFGGRIEAVGNVSIMGSLSNVTLNSSELSLQDVMDEMNAYIQAQQAAGDAALAGVPLANRKNLEFHDQRADDYTAPVEGNGDDIREVSAVDTGAGTVVDTGAGTPAVVTTNIDEVTTAPVDTGAGTPLVIPVDPGKYTTTAGVVTAVTPSLTPTAPVSALLAAGLNTIAETNPEFNQYANFITSNYMMDVDRLQYRDDLINNTSETILAAFGKSDVIADVGDLDYLNRPVQVPARDGSGVTVIYPAATKLELGREGALIRGADVVISGDEIRNSGAILAAGNASITGNSITGTGGAIIADAGELALTALGSIALDDTALDGASIDIIAGQDFTGKGVKIAAKTDASIFAVAGVTLTALEKDFRIERKETVTNPFTQESTTRVTGTTSGTGLVTSSLTVGGDLSIISSADLELTGVKGDIGGDISLSAGGNLVMDAAYSSVTSQSGNAKNGTDITERTSHVTGLTSGGDFIANAGGKAVLAGSQIDAGGKLQLGAVTGVELAAAADFYSSEVRKSKSSWLGLKKKSSTETIANTTYKGARLAASGNVDVIAETGDLKTAGTAFVSNNGDINLTAVEGDILAGVYQDVFEKQTTKKTKILGGLLGSSSNHTTKDVLNTGTDALAALDLSLVSGKDTTLIGATLAAGQKLNINTGGNFSVQAAIDSQKSDFSSQKSGLVLMTTIQENSFVQTAVLSRLLAGQGLNLGIGGKAALEVFKQTGVDAPKLEDLYPEELLALDGLQLLSKELANTYFYDKKTQLSPAFKALVGAALSFTGVGSIVASALGTTGAVASGVGAFVNSAIVGTLDGIAAGKLDIGDILEGAAFAGMTAGLTAKINLKTLGVSLGKGAQVPLLGFGNGNFSLTNILEQGLDNIITSGLSSAVYGTDFADSFIASFTSSMLDLVRDDVQNAIGANFAAGSAENAVSHVILGCVTAKLGGADCAAGAVGAITEQLYTAAMGNQIPKYGTTEYLAWKAENETKLQLISAAVGFVFSGGKAENVNAASDYAVAAFGNNYLNREQRERAEKLDEAFAELIDTLANCNIVNLECYISPSLIEKLEAVGISGHGLVYGEPVPYSVITDLRGVIDGAVTSLREASMNNTLAMLNACTGSEISADCAGRLEEARDFLEWDNGSWFDSSSQYTVGSDVLNSELEWGRDLDQMIVDEMTKVQKKEQNIEAAQAAIVVRASKYDGAMNVITSVTVGAGVGIGCYFSAGALCVLAAVTTGAAQGDELVDGVLTYANGKPVRNPTVGLLMMAGASDEQARQIEEWIDRGAMIVDIGGGVLIAAKGGTLLGRTVIKPSSTVDDVVTPPRVPGAPKGGMLSGRKAKTNSSDPEAIRGIDRENEAAEILSNNGHDIVQNPGTNAVGKNPDLTIDGEIYDVYSPSSSSARNLGSAIGEKVSSGQTDNVVVNLADSSVTPEQLTQQLTDYPVEGLNNVVIIDNSGNVLPPLTFN